MKKSSKDERLIPRKSEKKSRGFKGLLVVFWILLLLGFMAFALLKIVARPPDIELNVPNYTWDYIAEQTKTEDTKDPEKSDSEDSEGQETSQDLVRKEDFYTILLSGTDKGTERTDVMMLVAFDTKAGSVDILNIPRDTIVDVPRKIKKINDGYGGGADRMKSEVFDVTGIPVDRYAVIDFKGFERVIDAIGGVRVNVPFHMVYDDPAQNLHIDIPQGEQVLNGEQALKFVRYRKSNEGESGGYKGGDLQRIDVRTDFLKAALKQVASPKNILRINEIMEVMMESVDTDMSISELLWFATQGIGVDGGEIENHVLPGYSKMLKEKDYQNGKYISYYIPQEQEILQLVCEKLNPFTTDITKLRLKDLSVYGIK